MAALALAGVLLAAGAAAQQRMDGELTSTPVRGSVHVLVMPAAGNVGVSAGPDGAFIIDDQFAPMVPKIRAAVQGLTDKPVRYILNTHWHGDHTGGNAALGGAGYVIVAHDNVRTRMSRENFNAFFNATTPASPPEALPVITFSDRMTFHFNGDTIRVEHVANAHTDGDAIFYFENADVIHAGDVFVRYGYPFVDLSSGGSIAGMLRGLDRILAIAGAETLVIPGHGAVARRPQVEEFRGFLASCRDRVLTLARQGKGLDEIIAAKPLAEFDARWGKGFVKADQFVATIYNSEKASL